MVNLTRKFKKEKEVSKGKRERISKFGLKWVVGLESPSYGMIPYDRFMDDPGEFNV